MEPRVSILDILKELSNYVPPVWHVHNLKYSQ